MSVNKIKRAKGFLRVCEYTNKAYTMDASLQVELTSPWNCSNSPSIPRTTSLKMTGCTSNITLSNAYSLVSRYFTDYFSGPDRSFGRVCASVCVCGR